MWIIALDDFILADYGILPSMLTNKSSTLGFGVDRRAGIYSSVFFGSSSQPATWHVIMQCPDEAARHALTAVLAAPRQEQVRLLVQRDLYNEDLVTTYAAITSAPPKGSSDNFEVTFESNDSVWIAEDADTTAKTFSSVLDEAMHLPVPGNVPTNGIIRLTPTVQRTAPTATVGWKYRSRFSVTNNSDAPIFRYPLRLTLGSTTSIVSGGKAQADGDDVRLWLDGLEQARTLITWNTSASYMWFIVPALPAGESITYDMVYGNPSATAPPTLTYPDLPAFDLATSANDQWTYLYNTAGKGLWYISATSGAWFADYGVPGAWHRNLMSGDPNSPPFVLQRSITSSPRTAIPFLTRTTDEVFLVPAPGAQGGLPFDGVVLNHPLGVTTLTFAFAYYSESWTDATQTVTTTIGDTSTSDDVIVRTHHADTMFRVVIAARDSDNDAWNNVATFDDSTETSPSSGVWGYATVASAAYTMNAKHVAISITPNSITLPEGENGGVTHMLSSSNIVVGIDSTDLVIATTEFETEIYELATELRLHGGASRVGNYHALLIGNARGESGAGTPRAAVKYGTQGLQIDTERRAHSVWDTAFTVKAENLSTHAVRAIAGYISENTTEEMRASQWLPLTQPRTLVPNGAFDLDVASWEFLLTDTGLTAAWTHDATVGGEQLGAFKANISANAAAGVASTSYLHAMFFALNGRESVEVAVSVRVSNTNIRAYPLIYWYNNESDTEIAIGGVTLGMVPINTWFRRCIAALAPENATRYRIALRARAESTGQTGSAWFDDVTVNDAELVVADAAMGALGVSAIIRPRWVP